MFRDSIVATSTLLFAALSVSCGSRNPNEFRVLTSIAVTPLTADAQDYPEGKVSFIANGTFSLPPLTGPVTFTPPYTGQFRFSDPADTNIATIVSTGPGSATIQCLAGATGTVGIVASAAANNGTDTVVSGNAQLTCP